MAGNELKTVLAKLETLQKTLQLEKANLPYTTKDGWKENPNYTLYLLQQHTAMFYLQIFSAYSQRFVKLKTRFSIR